MINCKDNLPTQGNPGIQTTQSPAADATAKLSGCVRYVQNQGIDGTILPAQAHFSGTGEVRKDEHPACDKARHISKFAPSDPGKSLRARYVPAGEDRFKGKEVLTMSEFVQSVIGNVKSGIPDDIKSAYRAALASAYR